MGVCARLLIVIVFLWSGASGGVNAAAPPSTSVLLGSPVFQPSADHPVGWRGDGTGRYPGATPPIQWDRKKNGDGYTTEGILWMTPLPNKGVSSPIIVGDRIFLTAEVADLVCLDKRTGRMLWIRSNPEFDGLDQEHRNANPEHAEKMKLLLAQLPAIDAAMVEELNAHMVGAATSDRRPPTGALTKKREIQKEILSEQLAIDGKKSEYALYGAQNVFGYAGPTPTSDGKRICVFFATGVAACYDLDGNRQWIVRGKGGGAEHGNFASPVLCGNQLVVWANELRSYDTASGKLLWTNRCQPRNTYGSPFALKSGGEFVVASQNGTFVRLRDGKLLWNKGDGFSFDDAVPTPIVEHGMIYAHGGYKDEVGFKAYKIPASTDEAGKIAPAFTFKTEWADDELPVDPKRNAFDRSFTASPLFVDGLVYRLSQAGGLIVNDATTGEVVYRKVLPMNPLTSYWNWAGASTSPTLSGNYIYLMDNQGTAIVIERGRKYKEVAKNLLQDLSRDDGRGKGGKLQIQYLSTPVFDGERMYYRTDNYLFCIGNR